MPHWESGRNSSVYTLKKSVPDVRVPYAENLDKLLKPWALKQTRRLSGTP